MDVLMNQLRQRLVWQENPGSGADYIPTGDTFGATTINDWMNPDREVSMRILMEKSVFPTDGTDPYYEYTEFDDTEIVSYSINEQCGEPGIKLGGTVAATFSLSLDNTNRQYVSADFENTRFAVVIGLQNPGQTNVAYEPFGVFWISNAHASEQSTTVDIEGMDALGSQYEKVFWPFADDDAAIQISYASMRDMMDSIVEVWQDISLETIIDDDGNVEVSPATYPLFGWKITEPGAHEQPTAYSNFLTSLPPEIMYVLCNSGNCTKRQIISWFSMALGCFAAVGRDGELEFRAYDKTSYDGYSDYTMYVITPSIYFDYTPQDVGTFALNYMSALYYPGSDPNVTKLAQQSRVPDSQINAYTSIELPASPFMTASLNGENFGNYWYNSYAAEGLSVSVVGAPQFRTGQMYFLDDLAGARHRFSVNSMTTTYDGGLGMTLECNLPADTTVHSASYNQHTSLLSELQFSQYGKAQYSTEETVTGTRWIDGKPLYRKVIYTTTKDTISLASLNFDFIRWELAYKFTFGTGTAVQWSTTYYYGSNDYAMVYVNGTNLIIRMANNIHLIDAYIILEYTKAST